MKVLETQFWGSFIVCGFLCIILQLYSRYGTKSSNDTGISGNNNRFSAFKNNYLFVFLLAMFADWLQGLYLYFLYFITVI